MEGIDYFSWFVLIVIIITAIVCFIVLGQLPGKIAASNNHPQAKAINVASWLGLIFTFGVIWVIAMVWANTTPASATGSSDEIQDLKQRLSQVEAQLKALER